MAVKINLDKLKSKKVDDKLKREILSGFSDHAKQLSEALLRSQKNIADFKIEFKKYASNDTEKIKRLFDNLYENKIFKIIHQYEKTNKQINKVSEQSRTLKKLITLPFSQFKKKIDSTIGYRFYFPSAGQLFWRECYVACKKGDMVTLRKRLYTLKLKIAFERVLSLVWEALVTTRELWDPAINKKSAYNIIPHVKAAIINAYRQSGEYELAGPRAGYLHYKGYANPVLLKQYLKKKVQCIQDLLTHNTLFPCML